MTVVQYVVRVSLVSLLAAEILVEEEQLRTLEEMATNKQADLGNE